MDQLGDFIHKERSKEKYNKTTGHIDNLEKYSNRTAKSNGKSVKRSQSDKLIQREANYLKNNQIDLLYDQLIKCELIMDHKYKAFWCGAMHKLGTAFVEAQANQAMQYGNNPAALFHFLINKELNKRKDPYGPRLNREEH